MDNHPDFRKLGVGDHHCGLWVAVWPVSMCLLSPPCPPAGQRCWWLSIVSLRQPPATRGLSPGLAQLQLQRGEDEDRAKRPLSIYFNFPPLHPPASSP